MPRTRRGCRHRGRGHGHRGPRAAADCRIRGGVPRPIVSAPQILPPVAFGDGPPSLRGAGDNGGREGKTQHGFAQESLLLWPQAMPSSSPPSQKGTGDNGKREKKEQHGFARESLLLWPRAMPSNSPPQGGGTVAAGDRGEYSGKMWNHPIPPSRFQSSRQSCPQQPPAPLHLPTSKTHSGESNGRGPDALNRNTQTASPAAPAPPPPHN